MSSRFGNQKILDQLERERYERRMADLDRQYDALRAHLDAISRETQEHFEARMAIATSSPTVVRPNVAIKPRVVEKIVRKPAKGKKVRGRR